MIDSHDLWVEISRCALQRNFAAVRSYVGESVGIIAVVKANSYGHGLIEAARTFEECGASAVAVTRLDEAISLRDAGIKSNILIMSPIQPGDAEHAVAHNLDCTVSSFELVESLSNAAAKLGTQARCHIKIDTGMGRIGILPERAPDFFQSAQKCKAIEISGIYTHFATAADSDLAFCKAQLARFNDTLNALRDAGISYGQQHAANSAAIVRLPDSRYSLVRPGTLLYGQYPSANVPKEIELKPTWRLLGRICEVKRLPAGHSVGYGREYVCKKPTTVAVAPAGWADGYGLVPEGPIYRRGILDFAARKLRRRLTMKVNGTDAPVIGRVAMQMTILDVSHISGVSVGDIVEIPAMRIPTSSLIPRVYLDSE